MKRTLMVLLMVASVLGFAAASGDQDEQENQDFYRGQGRSGQWGSEDFEGPMGMFDGEEIEVTGSLDLSRGRVALIDGELTYLLMYPPAMIDTDGDFQDLTATVRGYTGGGARYSRNGEAAGFLPLMVTSAEIGGNLYEVNHDDFYGGQGGFRGNGRNHGMMGGSSRGGFSQAGGRGRMDGSYMNEDCLYLDDGSAES